LNHQLDKLRPALNALEQKKT